MQKSTFKESMLKNLLTMQAFGILLFIIILWLFMSLTVPPFLSHYNISDIFLNAAVISLVAYGMTFVFLVGGIDLSVGSTMGVSGATAAYFLIFQNTSSAVAIIIAAIVGIFIGFINGLFITKMRLPDLIVTLAMMGIGRGIVYLMTGTRAFRGFQEHAEFLFIGQGEVFEIPTPIYISIGMLMICIFLLRFTAFGRNLFAIGSNKEAAKVVGINVDRNMLVVYMISGFFAAIAGVVLTARLTTAFAELGDGYELQAIAAAVLGGTSLRGGKAAMYGTFLGTFLISLTLNVLVLREVDPFWFMVVLGLFIIFATSIDAIFGEKD
jgi:ribose transport system permease protein